MHSGREAFPERRVPDKCHDHAAPLVARHGVPQFTGFRINKVSVPSIEGPYDGSAWSLEASRIVNLKDINKATLTQSTKI